MPEITQPNRPDGPGPGGQRGPTCDPPQKGQVRGRVAMMCTAHDVTDPRVTHKQAASLVHLGFEVSVFGRGTPDLRKNIEGVELHPFFPDNFSWIRRLRLLRPIARAVRGFQPDVITCHEPESLLAGLYRKWRSGTRVVFDCHELWHEKLLSSMPRLLRPMLRPVIIALFRTMARRCDWVTVVSPSSAEFFLPSRPDGHVEIIHNSPRPDDFPLCRQDVPGPVTVVHEGVLNRDRGIAQMLQALGLARREADVRLLLVGKVEPRDQALYDEAVASAQVGEAVEGPQWVSYRALGQAVSRGQIGIVAMQPTPNNYLSLSNKVYNYMACAQPVIVPRGSATADLVRDAEAGLIVDTTDPTAIAEAMVRLARDANLRRRLGDNGRRAIEDRLGWHRMEERLAEIYGLLASRKATR